MATCPAIVYNDFRKPFQSLSFKPKLNTGLGVAFNRAACATLFSVTHFRHSLTSYTLVFCKLKPPATSDPRLSPPPLYQTDNSKIV